MFKFVAQLLISATVGLAVAAGSNPDVRGHVEHVWKQSNAYIQQAADLAADTATNIAVQADANEGFSTQVDANIVAGDTAASEGTSVESTSDVQVDGGLNIDTAIPQLPDVPVSVDLQAEATADAQTETDASVELLDDTNLTLAQMLALKFNLGLSK